MAAPSALFRGTSLLSRMMGRASIVKVSTKTYWYLMRSKCETSCCYLTGRTDFIFVIFFVSSIVQPFIPNTSEQGFQSEKYTPAGRIFSSSEEPALDNVQLRINNAMDQLGGHVNGLLDQLHIPLAR